MIQMMKGMIFDSGTVYSDFYSVTCQVEQDAGSFGGTLGFREVFLLWRRFLDNVAGSVIP
jgi:hypothetical protein